MGNLGAYQDMVTMAKRLGGPKRLAVVAGATGYVLLRSLEAGGKKALQASQTALNGRSAPCATKGQLFEVTADGTDSRTGLTLHSGDSFRVLECDADSILIEVPDNPANPYFVSRQLLTALSDFPAEDPTVAED